MAVDEIVSYLQDDLKQSVIDDVQPCIQLNSPRGGFFAVPKLVLTYVDYLGALYHGYKGERNRSGRRIFAKSDYAKAFLHEIFGQIDQNYLLYGDLLWEIYRNGTVHMYEPMTLRNTSGESIEWHVFKSALRKTMYHMQINGASANYEMVHLVPMLKPGYPDPSLWIQPISIGCLYNDLLAAIEIYARLVRCDSSVESRFRKTVNELLLPEATPLVWS